MDNNKTTIYKFDSDGNAVNPDLLQHEIEVVQVIKYKIKITLRFANNSVAWVGGGSIESVEGYPILKKIVLDCNSCNAVSETPKKAILSTLFVLISEAHKLKYPQVVIQEISILYNQYSQYNLFEND